MLIKNVWRLKTCTKKYRKTFNYAQNVHSFKRILLCKLVWNVEFHSNYLSVALLPIWTPYELNYNNLNKNFLLFLRIIVGPNARTNCKLKYKSLRSAFRHANELIASDFRLIHSVIDTRMVCNSISYYTDFGWTETVWEDEKWKTTE